MAKSVFPLLRSCIRLQLGTIFICSGHRPLLLFYCAHTYVQKSMKHSFVISAKCFLDSFLVFYFLLFLYLISHFHWLLVCCSCSFHFLCFCSSDTFSKKMSFVRSFVRSVAHYIIVYLCLSPAVNVSILSCLFSFLMLILCRRSTI